MNKKLLLMSIYVNIFSMKEINKSMHSISADHKYTESQC